MGGVPDFGGCSMRGQQPLPLQRRQQRLLRMVVSSSVRPSALILATPAARIPLVAASDKLLWQLCSLPKSTLNACTM